MSKVKFGENRFREGDDLQNDVEVINYTLDDADYNKAIGDIVFNEDALKMIYLIDMDKAQIKSSIEHFLLEEFVGTDKTNEEIEEELSDFIENNKLYYSFFAEALSVPVLSELFSFEPIRSTIGYAAGSTVLSQGADSVLYDEKTKSVVMVEAKFFSNFDNAITKVGKSIVEYGEKIRDLFRSVKVSEKDIIIYGKKTNGINADVSDSGLIKFGEMKQLKKIIVGFILHEEKKSYKNEIIKFNRNNGYLKNSEFGFVDKVYLIHLPIKNKKDFILDIQLRAKEILDNE